MGVNDDHQKAAETDHHVSDGKYAVNGNARIDIGEVIDGSDKGIPWEEKAETESKVDYVGQVENVFWGILRDDGV